LPRHPKAARHGQIELADRKRCCLRDLYSRPVAKIGIDSIWLASEPMDMCAGTETALARVVAMSVQRSRSVLTLRASFVKTKL
jgi:hypothetical protein